jgi:large subunit ribosomal protein L15
MPLVRRVPKRGFFSPFKVEFQVVNVDSLNKLAEAGRLLNGVVTPEVLNRLGVVRKSDVPVKILGTGELSAKLEVSAHAFSKSAITKIENAGGKVQPISAGSKQ